MRAEVVATGLAFPEGPVACGDGSVAVVAVAAGTVHRVWPATGAVELLADTAGGPNAAAPTDDGGFVVTQNGGFDFGDRFEGVTLRPVRPGLQRVLPSGEVRWIVDTGLLAPNDLAVATDGRLLFTDPGRPRPDPDRRVGRVMALEPDGSLSTLAEGFGYCNGIALEPDGTPVVVEARGLQRLLPDGGREWVVEVLGPGGGDGFCVDAEGRFYVAALRDHGVRVIEPDGTEVDFLAIDGEGATTNCCFGGPDGRTLYATDGFPGHLVAWQGMPTAGLPLTPWLPTPPAFAG